MEIVAKIDEDLFKKAIEIQIADIIANTVSGEVENNVGDLVEKSLEEKLSCIEEYISIPDLSQRVVDDMDYDNIADEVYNRVDMSDLARDVTDYLDDPDVEDKAHNLLEAYTPGNGCSLGNSFTRAIKDAIEYLLETDSHFVNCMRLAMIDVKKAKIVEDHLASHVEYQNFLRAKAEQKAAAEKIRLEEVNKLTSNPYVNSNQQSA